MYSQIAGLAQSVSSEFNLRLRRSPRTEMRSWCLQELAPWLQPAVPDAVARAEYRGLNDTHRWVFLYRIGYGRAELLDKPAACGAGEAAEGEEPPMIRALLYRTFLDRAARRLPALQPHLIAVDVGDQPVSSAAVPVFSFQKRTGANNILLPDVDFLNDKHVHPSWLSADWRPFRRKSNSAIFVGSTTGGRIITQDMVQTSALPRLRAAHYFRGQPNVVFRLAKIVHCDTPETEAALRALGFGAGAASWKEQFRHRFILSMDGNGATCSRVAVTLKSRSVLLKYASDNVLYYFHGLKPWQHYIPIERDECVEPVIALARRDPGLFAAISRAGRSFSATFLTRRMLEEYATELLSLYASLCPAAQANAAVAEFPANPSPQR